MTHLADFLTTCLQADWAERTGWTLVHSVWQIAAITGVYAILILLLRNRSASARYLVGCVAMAAMLVLPAVTYVVLPTSVMPEVETLSDQTPVTATPLPKPSMTPREFTFTEPEAIVVDPPATAPILAEDEAPTFMATLSSSLQHCIPWITAAWLVGVLLLSFRPLWGWLHVRRLRRHGLAPLSDPLQEICGNLAIRLGVRRVVEFAQSALVEVPTVVGYLKPMILLPASVLSGLSTSQIELILAHELAHVRRHDYLVNLVQTVVESLLFYHPGMWWVSGQIRRERENCCDDIALALGGSRANYVRALAQLEERRSVPTAALAASGGSLLLRARRLLGQPQRGFGYRHATAWLAGIVTIGLVAAVLAMNGVAQGDVKGAAKEKGNPGEAVSATEEAESDMHQTLKWGPVTDGLRMAAKLFPKKDTYALGEKIELEFHVRNVSDHAITIAGLSWRQDAGSDSFVIKNEAGEKLTVGHSFYTGFTPIERKTLKPGEIAVFKSSPLVFLAKGIPQPEHPVGHTVVTKPGRHTLQFNLVFPDAASGGPEGVPQPTDWQGTLRTGTVEVSIDDSEVPPAKVNEQTLSIIDSSGKPIKGAHIRFERLVVVKEGGLNPGQYAAIGEAVSDADGKVVIPAVTDPKIVALHVCVEAPGYVSRGSYYDGTIQRDPRGKWNADPIVLLRSGVIQGRVLGPDGKPLAGAPLSVTVSCDYSDYWHEPGKAPNRVSFFIPNHSRAISNENGEFQLEGVPPGKVTIYYPWEGPIQGELDSGKWKKWTKPGQRYPLPPVTDRGWVKFIELDEGERVEDVVVDLSKSSAEIDGQVVDEQGRPVADASVWAVWKREGLSWFSFPDFFKGGRAKTDAEGRFHLSGLPPGAAAIASSHPDLDSPKEPVAVELEAGKTGQARVVMTRKVKAETSAETKVLPDGIYRVRGSESKEKGVEVSRSDTDGTVVLLDLLSDRFGTASMTSMSNDNTRFRIDLAKAGPFSEGDDIGHMALMIDGLCVMVWSHSDPDENRCMNLSSSVQGKETSAKIAAALGVKPRLRENPGHKMDVRFSPKKTAFRPGEPVVLHIEIKNTGDRPFSFMDGGQQRGPRNNQFGFTAFRDAGKGPEVPDTGDATNFGGLAGFITLKPGEVFEKDVDITKWFDLSKPDTYKIDGRFEMEISAGAEAEHPHDWDDVARGTTLVVVAKEGKASEAKATDPPKAEDVPAPKAGEIVWDKPRRGWQVGAKLISTTGKLQPGDPVVVQLLLKNVTDESRTVVLQDYHDTHPTLGADGRISMNISGDSTGRRQHVIAPGAILERSEYRVVLSTQGMLPGEYRIDPQPAFWEPDVEDSNRATGIGRNTPVRFTLGDLESVKYTQPPVEKDPAERIYWGERVSGLVVGMRLLSGRSQWPGDARIEGEVFVRNLSDRTIRLEYEVPPAGEWNTHVTTSDGEDVRLDWVWYSGSRNRVTRELTLKPGEQSRVEGNGGPAIQVLKEKTPFKQGDPPRLITDGGRYAWAAYLAVAEKSIPDLTMVIGSGAVPFEIAGGDDGPSDDAPSLEQPDAPSGESETKTAEEQSDLEAMRAYAKALAAGDFETLEKTWEFQDDLDRQFAEKLARMFAKAKDMRVDLVSMRRLGEDSLFACFLMRGGPERFAGGPAPLFTTFQRKDGRWRCSPPGDLRSMLGARTMAVDRIGRRALSQHVIALRLGPMDAESQIARIKAQAEAFARLAGPPYNLSQFETAAKQLKDRAGEQEAALRAVKTRDDLWHLIVRESEKDMMPEADDFVLSFYLEAAEGEPKTRELSFADSKETFRAELFPCLTEDAVLEAKVVADPARNMPSVEVTLTEGGKKRFAQLTQDAIGRRLGIVVDGKVASAPIIRAPILGGKARVDGNFTLEEAEAIVGRLNAYREEAREFLEGFGDEERGPKGSKAEAR